MLEVGAYNPQWADVHMGPEQAVRAHGDLGGRVMLPIHWGTFELGPHGWTEPIERTLVAARAANISVLTPRPGQSHEPARPVQVVRWWPEIPWQTALQAPQFSSGIELSPEVASER